MKNLNKKNIRPNNINAMKAHCIQKGQREIIGETVYSGLRAVYQTIGLQTFKVQKGVPFIRMSQKKHEMKREQNV